MFTNNFINLMAVMILRSGVQKGLLAVKDTTGTTYYISPNLLFFPCSQESNFVTDAATAGIRVGTGNRAESAADYNLESQITSNMTGSVTTDVSLDDNGNPQITFTVVLTNSGSSAVTIREIGYAQTINTANDVAVSGTTQTNFLLDRTVLDTQVTIPARSSKTITYTLKTLMGANA